ncbi:MAG: VOC family protein [Ferruginibacter sp.]|nr:VOC family protein [Cytophagales bacterium]
MNNSTPKNYSTVCPYLMVDSIENQTEFLKTIFSATVKEALKTPDGTTQHGEVSIGDTVIMMGRGSKNFPSQPSMNYVFVHDADEIYRRALSHGATTVLEPADRFYGVREAGFKDFHGNTWWIAQPIKDVSLEEMEKGFAEIERSG